MGRARTPRSSPIARFTSRRSHLGLTLPALALGWLCPWPAVAQEFTPPAAPDILPGPPGLGYGTPGAPGTTAPVTAPTLTGLPSPLAGVADLPTTGPTGPAYLIQPRLQLGEILTDNVLQTATRRFADIESQLRPGISVITDTPRLQGTLSASAEYDKFAFTPGEDRLQGSLFTDSLATVVPGTVFIDLRSALTEASGSGATGFLNVNQLPRSQQTQVFTNTISPFYRTSFAGLDGELRYRFSSTSFSGGTLAIAPTTPGGTSTSAQDTTEHEATLTIGTGEAYGRLTSRLTVDAAKIESTSLAQSTQLNTYDDLQYQFNDTVAATGRLGYNYSRYPLSPGANLMSPTYLIGGQVQFGPRGFVSLQYGRQQGTNGLNGSAHYDITPLTSVTASLSQGRSSPQQQIQNALATTTLTATGTLVNQTTGLPTSIVNPQFGLQTTIFDFRNFSLGVNSALGDNVFGLFAAYDQRIAVSSAAGSSSSKSLNFNWSRQLTPDLSSSATLGYSTVTNATLGTIPGAGNNNKSYTANLGLTYILAVDLTASVLYSFIHLSNPIPTVIVTNPTSGSVVVNTLQLTITKVF